jgi:hypothetical protein
MYRIIGNDGKIYGPAGADKIREWIAQGRADKRTAVFVDGADDWTFLGLLSEFARDFSGPPPALTPLVPSVKNNNSFAIAGLVCGLVSWLGCCCCAGFPFNLLGLIFSIIALAQINECPGGKNDRAAAIAGLVLSALSLFWCVAATLLELATHPARVSWHFSHF